ncbi:hypothetical protein PF002_g18396 [Phytophthora fragariae]|uniref:Uncharacterized protein n=1 Tax=Phytophthora fragariae TaxID=53985 RepID=A0A6A3Q5R9_9STRA|nr:hypothetical protein PF003_g25833 [Phytophthora fragariae]KAE8890378.1 hypothetical protein PF003_g25829 [Phytophthora fragariae]KAE8890470.1 hypothetical protein PF003_g25841 [Phytophthora fragariae]KAE9069207.1 hypothetical protein PF007_g27403 [Phytophthora fragariae]KAE9211903.1 hypothetical protein PF002_g18396 [Phytophthora fragariae]
MADVELADVELPAEWEEANWSHIVAQVVADTVESSWTCRKYVVLISGLPGAGKSALSEVLAREFREALREKPNKDGSSRLVRVCSSSFDEVHAVCAATRDPTPATFAEKDIAFSLQAADVVIIDEMNLTESERKPILDTVTTQLSDMKCDGEVCMVKLSCRDESHAFELYTRSWRSLSDDELRARFQKYVADSSEDMANVYTVDPNM